MNIHTPWIDMQLDTAVLCSELLHVGMQQTHIQCLEQHCSVLILYKHMMCNHGIRLVNMASKYVLLTVTQTTNMTVTRYGISLAASMHSIWHATLITMTQILC